MPTPGRFTSLPRIAAATALAATLASLPAAAGPPAMPAFDPALAPLVGTWKRVHHDEKKDVTLYLVIKEEGGQLRIRYELPHRYKKFDSDWFGRIEVDLEVNMKEKREVAYRVETEPPRILQSETISYTGTSKSRRLIVDSSYELAEDGKLHLRCLRVREAKDEDKEYTCPPPMAYERVSTGTEWPD